MSDDVTKLAVMLETAYDVAAAVSGKDKRALDNDLLLLHSLALGLGTIGMMTDELPKTVKTQHKQTDWETLASLRKFLLLQFARDNEDLVWQAVEEKLPVVIAELQAIVPPDEDED